MSESNKEKTVKINREKYTTTRTAAGTKSLSNGDQVALALAGLTTEEVYEVADAFIGENEFKTKYAHLNGGMQRMNLGNRIRGHINAIDKANAKDAEKRKAEGKVEKTYKSGLEKFEKAVGPFVKAAQKRSDEEAKAKAAAKSEKAAQKRSDEEAKAKAKAAAKSEKGSTKAA